MVVHHQMTLEYSVATLIWYIFWFSNLLKRLVLLKCMIHGNDYLTFCSNIGQKGNLADMWGSARINKESLFSLTKLFILFTEWAETFTLVWAMFMKVCEKFMHNTANNVSFHVQGLWTKWYFQHLYWQDSLNLLCI